MGIAVLGPLSIDGGNVSLGRRDRTVLAALAVHPGDEVRTERLCDALWGESPPPSATKVVQGCVVRLRKALGSGAIQTTLEGYRLAVPTEDVDAWRFDRAVRRGSEHLESGAPDRALAVLSDALGWWRGEPLPELEEWDVGRQEAERLGQLRLQAEELYVEAALACGEHERVLSLAMAMVHEAPLRERRWMLLARTHYRAGRQSDALETLRRLRRVLDRELGLSPGREVEDLERAILQQDPSLSALLGPSEASSACPYPGLLAYDVPDSGSFFGRETDLAACLQQLRDRSVLAVSGPSGTGKSSLVRAGIAASLLRSGGRVSVMTPGAHPVSTLGALRLTGSTVLVVDQFEEVFSLCADEAERDRFLENLVIRSAGAPLVVSIRADYLSEVARHPGFARLLEHGLYLLGPLTEAGLREAIEGPAREAGLVVEPGLVDLLVNETEGRPGALPMLSHTLSETWHRREGRTLTIAGYQNSGGIRGAIAQTAEAIHDQCDAEGRTALRDIMLRLVTLGSDGEPLRARLPRRQVVKDTAHDDVFNLLIAARLLTSDEGVVEMAHEALARAWPRLRGWLDEDVDGQRIRQHLTIAADAWDALGRPDAELYRGARLSAALDWRRTADAALPEVEAAFLGRGERLADIERVESATRAQRQAATNRRLRGLLVVAVGLLSAAIVTGVLAILQADRADRARGSAEGAEQQAARAARVAESRRLGARALTTEDISLSLLLAVEGVLVDDSEESRANLVAALMRRPELALTGVDPPGRLGGLAGGGSQGLLASSAGTNEVLFFTRSLSPLGTLQLSEPHRSGHDLELAFSRDGTVLAAAPKVAPAVAAESPVTLIDAYSHTPTARQPRGATSGPAAALDLDFSRDGRFLAGTFQAGDHRQGLREGAKTYALVWDLRRAAVPRRIVLPSGPQGVALSPDGQTLYTSWPLAAYDVRSGHMRWRSSVRGWGYLDLDRSGTRLALPSWDGLRNRDVLIVTARSGSVVRRLTGHRETVREVVFSPRTSTVAASGIGGTVMVWNLRTGVEEHRLDTGAVNGIAFSQDGSYLITSGADGALRLWDLPGRLRFVRRTAVPRPVEDPGAAAYPSPDGRAIAFAWRARDGSHRLAFHDVDVGDTGAGLLLGKPLNSGVGAWRSDRRLFATASGNQLRLWDRVSGREVRHAPVTGSVVTSVAFARDQRRLVVADSTGQVRMVDVRTLEPDGSRASLGGHACCLGTGPEDRTTVVMSAGSLESEDPGHVAHDLMSLVDPAHGSLLRRHEVGADVLTVATTTDGRRAALGLADGRLEIVDVATGRSVRSTGSGHEPAPVWVAFSRQGRQVVTASVDGSVRLWDAAEARLLSTVRLPEHTSLAATFLAGDDDVLLASRHGGVYRWTTSVERALHFACDLAGRDMRRGEWTELMGDRSYRGTCEQRRQDTKGPKGVDPGGLVGGGAPPLEPAD